MISKRVSLSRDLYSSGEVILTGLGGAALFYPLNAFGAPTTPPPTNNGIAAPIDALPVIFADRLFVSNPGASLIFVRPVIVGSKEAPGFPYPQTLYGGQSHGASNYNAEWTGVSLVGLAVAPIVTNGIIVPAGAIAFPIEIVCVGLVVGGTAAAILTFAAYGTNKRG